MDDKICIELTRKEITLVLLGLIGNKMYKENLRFPLHEAEDLIRIKFLNLHVQCELKEIAKTMGKEPEFFGNII